MDTDDFFEEYGYHALCDIIVTPNELYRMFAEKFAKEYQTEMVKALGFQLDLVPKDTEGQ